MLLYVVRACIHMLCYLDTPWHCYLSKHISIVSRHLLYCTVDLRGSAPVDSIAENLTQIVRNSYFL